jgi:hypothetical protein
MIASAPQKPSAQASQIDNFTPALSQAELQAYGYRSAATGGQAEAAQEKGPPVSEQHLKAWFDLYKQVYQGAADTEANALKSAAGMFPGKLVSRDRVRALRGAQKRGRKPNEPAK